MFPESARTLFWTDDTSTREADQHRTCWRGADIRLDDGRLTRLSSMPPDSTIVTRLDVAGHPHSEALHLRERFRRRASDTWT